MEKRIYLKVTIGNFEQQPTKDLIIEFFGEPELEKIRIGGSNYPFDELNKLLNAKIEEQLDLENAESYRIFKIKEERYKPKSIQNEIYTFKSQF